MIGRGRFWRGAIGVCLTGAAAMSGGCKRENAVAAPAPGVPVAVANAARRDVPIEVRTIGSVEPLATVTLRPQVSGQLTQVKFVEGQDVHAGDLLLMLDPRPFESALAGAEANLARSTVLSEDAAQAAEQNTQALQSRAVSDRQAQEARAAAAAAAAAVKAAQAAVDMARLQLDYCSIRAPFDGRTGYLAVKQGTVVKENETSLVDITQISPIGVGFAVPEQYLSSILGRPAGDPPLVVTAAPPGDSTRGAEGVVNFVDNKVDNTTGTIRLRGTFPNKDRRLWPGQFVNVVLTLGTEHGAVVIPSRAVQTTQAGQFVFVVGADGTVQSKPVEVGRTIGGEAVVTRGLAGDEVVVTEGQLRLVPGSKVETKAPAADPARAKP